MHRVRLRELSLIVRVLLVLVEVLFHEELKSLISIPIRLGQSSVKLRVRVPWLGKPDLEELDLLFLLMV